jgi:hypothetical protein
MPRVRVFLPTYRRPGLLERAVESLRRQTCPDWVCEVHNDAPDDDGPRRLLERLKDARFTLLQHPRNLGGTATFNLFYRATVEPFYSILEDDNWWEPEFLAAMLGVADQHPDAAVLWANMRIWREQPGGKFVDSGTCIHTIRSDGEPERVSWGTARQVMGAIHSNGAALHRSREGLNYQIPHVPFAAIEMFRERVFPHPLLFVRQPLANYSVTLRSERSNNRAEWAEAQTALTATFLKHARYGDSTQAQLWQCARAQQPPTTSTLILAALVEEACRSMLRHALAKDWWLFLRGTARHPQVLTRVLRSRRVHAEWWEFLERNTRARFEELQADCQSQSALASSA